jgi:hypothetical protein
MDHHNYGRRRGRRQRVKRIGTQAQGGRDHVQDCHNLGVKAGKSHFPGSATGFCRHGETAPSRVVSGAYAERVSAVDGKRAAMESP